MTSTAAAVPPQDPPALAPPSERLSRWEGRGPTWYRPWLLVLLVLTAVAYLAGLSGSGYGNSFYAAASQASAMSLKAWLFGSVDSANAITVDKPPAATWVSGLSVRLFGLSSWSVLAPQALMGVASVALTFATVKRWAGPAAGLFAGAVLAAAPVAVLMFRFNNPDALLVLALVAAAYALVRAVDAAPRRSGTWWLVVCGALLGVGFLAKELQALVVLPALALAYLVAADVGWGRRIGQLLAGGAALIVSAGWYLALVELWPASSRPYIGGSTDNSLLGLTLGYNGLGRFSGSGSGFPGGGSFPGGGGTPGVGVGGSNPFGGSAGLTRLFTPQWAGQASWLLPAALILLVGGLWATRWSPRTDRTRAALILWGGWMVVTGVVFSYLQGIAHSYYTVALMPGIAGVVATTVPQLWSRRDERAARWTLSGVVAVTTVWSFVLLILNPDFVPWLRWVVLVAGLLGALAQIPRRVARPIGVVAVALALLGVFGGSTAFAVQTAATPHQGGLVSAGPSQGLGGAGVSPSPAMLAQIEKMTERQLPANFAQQMSAMMGSGGGMGGPPSQNVELNQMLRTAGTTWSAATVSTSSAASYELATDTAVIGIGGFLGSDPAPTLEQFQADVAAGRIRYFIADRLGGGMPGMGGGSDGAASGGGASNAAGPGGAGTGSQIQTWVRQHYTARVVAGTTTYDLITTPH